MLFLEVLPQAAVCRYLVDFYSFFCLRLVDGWAAGGFVESPVDLFLGHGHLHLFVGPLFGLCPCYYFHRTFVLLSGQLPSFFVLDLFLAVGGLFFAAGLPPLPLFLLSG